MKRIAITSDCTCDLSDKILEEYGIRLFYYYINIDNGRFKDSTEITADNIIEYFENGGRTMSTVSPELNEVLGFYKKTLETYDEVVHISVSRTLSNAYRSAIAASEKFGGIIHVVDGMQLSSGTGVLIMRAAEMARDGKSVKEIVDEIEAIKNKVSTTFIMDNADGFYRTKRFGKALKTMCDVLKLHPVVEVHNGEMRLKTVMFGSFENAALRYAGHAVKHAATIDKKHIFITHSTCRVSLISKIKSVVMESGDFENVHITRSSATITGNCGANTVGVLYMRK